MTRFSAVAAIHDVTPAWEGEIVAIMDSLQSAVPMVHPALLLVPNFHGRTPLFAKAAFTSRIRTWIEAGSEPLLHGWTHFQDRPIHLFDKPIRWTLSKLLTASEGEFLDLEVEETARRLNIGRTILEQTLGVAIKGFVPPAWLRSRHLFEVLRQNGFRYTEGHFYIYDLAHKARLFAPALGFSGRTPLRATTSAHLAGLISNAPAIQSNIRLALHPSDFTHPKLRLALPALFRTLAKTHRFVSYAELLGGNHTV